MNFVKTILIAALNIVAIEAISLPFACTWGKPEWYCDSSKIGSDIKRFAGDQYRLSYKFCHDRRWCREADGLIPGFTDYDLVMITTAFYLPRCMVINLQQIKVIYGKNAGITMVEAWAFWNLNELEQINLSHNKINAIQYGVFSGLPVANLDLSWNEITLIVEGAFYDMKNLRKLDLSGNYLTLFDYSYFTLQYIQSAPYRLEKLVLSQNKLEMVNIYKMGFPMLNILDLSHNNIRKISKETLTVARGIIDLTDNLLTRLPSNWYTDTLKISFNNFKDPNFLTIDGVHSVILDGNPWMCEKYTSLLQYLVAKNIFLKSSKDEEIYFLTKSERENYPTCYISSGNYSEEAFASFINLRETYKNRANQECKCNDNCPSGTMCKSGRCWDPCKQNACPDDEICSANAHSFFCECPKVKLENPNTPFSRCYYPECTADFDCGINKECNNLNLCQEYISSI